MKTVSLDIDLQLAEMNNNFMENTCTKYRFIHEIYYYALLPAHDM